MSASDREIELKFSATAEAAQHLLVHELQGVSGRPMESVYFDTPDRELRAAGFSLRVRRDGDQWLQTLKAGRSGAMRRYEWERPLTSGELDADLLRETPLAKQLDGVPAQLEPVFVTRLQRRSRRIRDDRSDVELSLDEGEIVAGDSRLTVLEVELELKSGTPDALFVLANRLSDIQSLTLAFASKAERGYALADGLLERATKFRRPKLKPGESAREAFQAIGAACLRHLTLNADVLNRSSGMDSVHQVRIAIRRLRVALVLFKEVVADERLDQVAAELKWLAGELADARELDVFITSTFRVFASEVEDPVGSAAFGSAVLHAQTAAYVRARRAVGSARFRMLVLNSAQWIECGAWSESPQTAAHCETHTERFARRALDRCRRVLVRHGAQLDWQDAVARHRLRIRAKRMRYASEFFETAVPHGSSARRNRFVEHLELLQEKLGDLNDVATSRRTAAAALAADEEVDVAGVRCRALSAGLILGARQAGVPKLIRQARKAYRDLVETPAWWKG